ncbi:phage tail domain-containing protein [Streptomyces sp. NPDC048489]|uniref:phage tail domain-containing protein n=1 Tax=Streptomyces sp. NPDC048489 TaxID=3154504 RepID=UPI00343596DD
MPFPALPAIPESGEFEQIPLPVPKEWQRTYVSLRGNNGQGDEIPLTGFINSHWPAMMLQPGAVGLDMPPFEIFSDDSPNLDGSIYRGHRAAAREILLPVFIYGIDRSSMKRLKRQISSALNPRNGFAVLTFMESDGVIRRLTCYYKGGMEGAEGQDTSGFRWVSYGIQLTALDPWFYGEDEVAASWSFGTAQPMLGKFLPLTIGKGETSSGKLVVTNPGDIEAWPVWTLKGPIQSFKLKGPDGKATFQIPAPAGGGNAVAAGRTLTVDCRPGFKTLLDDQGNNYFPQLSANPSLWSLPSGTSTIDATLVSGSGSPSVTLTFTPRYAGY